MRTVQFKLSDADIIKVYSETKSLKKTALAAQGIKGTVTIAKKLRALGVEVKNHNLRPIQVTDEVLIQMYESGMSLMEIAQKVSGAKGAMSVKQRLNGLGVDTSYHANIHKYKEKMSKSFHKYTLDEHVFDCIDTEEKAYWIGFLMADGYNQEKKYAITLRLQIEDLEILEKFKRFLKSDCPIYSFTRITKVNHLKRTYCEVRCNSVYLSSKLASLGIIQGKTYSLDFPSYIPKNLMHHFIRGYFDGDGCLSISKKIRCSNPYQFTLTGKKEFLEKVQMELVNGAKVVKNALKIRKGTFAQAIHYNGFRVILRIMEYLYKDANIYLKRKYNKYLEMVSRQSNLQK